MAASIYGRLHHVALPHENTGRIFIWGGYRTNLVAPPVYKDCPPDEIVIYDPGDFSWTMHHTNGQAPPPKYNFITAQVIGDCMYVILAGDVYRLDINTLVWGKMEEEEEETVREDKPSYGIFVKSCVYGENIVVIGGLPSNIAVYDTRNNDWRRPACSGTPPPAGALVHSSFIVGSKAYIFVSTKDEDCADGRRCELLRLDVEAWRWEMMRPDPVSSSSSTSPNLGKGLHHTLTVLPPSLPPSMERRDCKVLLDYSGGPIGGSGRFWILRLDDLSWSWRVSDHLDRRPLPVGYRAVVEVATGQVWLLGGIFGGEGWKRIFKLTVTRPLSLVVLSFGAMVEEREGRLKRGIEELPRRLRTIFDNFVESEKEVVE